MDYIRHSELIAKFLSPSCDDFNKIAFISMPKQAIGSAGEFAGLFNQRHVTLLQSCYISKWSTPLSMAFQIPMFYIYIKHIYIYIPLPQ